MLRISRFSASGAVGLEALGKALLNWSFLCVGLNRPHIDELPANLRRDVGLVPDVDRPADWRDPRW